MKAFYIKTLGCKVNQYETQVIREGFLRQGYTEAEGIDEADICVVNSCTVTSTSDSKSLKVVRSALRKNKCVVVTGCLVEDRELDLARLAGARFIIKNKDKYRIPEIINRLTPHTSRLTNNGITDFKGHTRVFVKIQDGCDNVCSYCKVRIVRGRSKSRPVKEVIDECKILIENGSREIVLTGICLGAYGRDASKGIDLSMLTREICKIQGEWRLRLSSIEPKDITRNLILQLQKEKRFCRHLHMPFQSGDDYILRKMARPYKRSDYLDIVGRLKEAIPDIAISTDMMVGFPGETEKRFQNTVDFIKVVRPMRMHVFPFSRRRGTRAYDYKDGTPGFIKNQRRDNLSGLVAESFKEFVQQFTGKDVRVLVEDKKTIDGYLQGYTDGYIKVYIAGPDSLKGRFLNCQLTLTNGRVYGILPLHSF